MGRGWRRHGDGGRQPCGSECCPDRTSHCGNESDTCRNYIDGRVAAEDEEREAVGAGIDLGDLAAQPDTQRDADEYADNGDQRDELHVVPSNGPGRIAERLQQPDLLALKGDQAGQRHVDQECRHREEDRRQNLADAAQLQQFAVEERVGELVLAPIGPLPAIRREQGVDMLYGRLFGGAGHQLDDDIGKRAVEIVGSGEGLFRHPDDGEASRVGHDIARSDGVDELGR